MHQQTPRTNVGCHASALLLIKRLNIGSLCLYGAEFSESDGRGSTFVSGSSRAQGKLVGDKAAGRREAGHRWMPKGKVQIRAKQQAAHMAGPVRRPPYFDRCILG